MLLLRLIPTEIEDSCSQIRINEQQHPSISTSSSGLWVLRVHGTNWIVPVARVSKLVDRLPEGWCRVGVQIIEGK